METTKEYIESLEFHLKLLRKTIEDAQTFGANIQYARLELERLERCVREAKEALLSGNAL